MSFDFFTYKICPHEVIFETLTLDGMGMKAQFLRPPANKQVELYINGVFVPQTGLYSRATLPVVNRDPYNIKKNINDLLCIKIGFDAPRYIQLMSGSRVKASDIVMVLRQKIPELNIFVKNNYIIFESYETTNGVMFSFPDPRWVDTTSSLIATSRILKTYSALGITPGRSVRGKKIFPGWHVEGDPDSEDPVDRFIIFEHSIKNINPILQANYITKSMYCRRCQGSSIEYDYSIEGNTYATVHDLDLLIQEFDKFLFTRIGSHFKWGWLGSNLVDRIGSKGSTGNVLINTLVTVDINRAFNVYQDIKSQQLERFPMQKVTDAEFPYSMDGINVEELPNDPTVLIATANITSRTQDSLSFKRVLGNPNPYSLDSDPIRRLKSDPAFNFLPRA